MQSFSAPANMGPPGTGFQSGRLWVFPELDSTNAWVLAHLEDLQPGDVIRAIHQTHGRGRMNRVWIAPPGRALTLSLLLAPSRFPVAPQLIGQIAALGVARCLEQWAIPAQVKWPNDVLVAGRKIAGLLLETGSAPDRLVLGIGLNVNLRAEDLPPAQLRRPATSLQLETGREFNLEAVLLSLIESLEHSARDCASPDDLRRFWEAKDALRQHWIRIETGTETIEGRYTGIRTDGQLAVEIADHTQREFWSGDVERVDFTAPPAPHPDRPASRE